MVKRAEVYARGSFTIESACVMSLILTVLIGTLYLCFFVHNRAWLTAAAYEAALAGSMEGIRTEGRMQETAETRSRELGNIGFFGAENLSVQVSSGKSVKVSYSADTISDFGGFSWKLKTEGASKVIQPAEWIRKAKALKDIADRE
ncbi:MAG TPA: pilus assembly protein [Candidatus Blautia excrementipullorum]|nr:pilus assembly protein [Candidatus Blautia excrementipullorum]